MSKESKNSSLDLEGFFAICAEESRIPVFERLERAGYSGAALDEILTDPSALQRALQMGINRYLIPIVPRLIKNLAARVESGDKAASMQVIALLGDKSPLKEAGGMEVSSASDDALTARAAQLSKQLHTLIEGLGTRKHKDA